MDGELYTFTLAGIKKVVDDMLDDGAIAEAPCYFIVGEQPLIGKEEDVDIFNIANIDEVVSLTEQGMATAYVFRGEGTVFL